MLAKFRVCVITHYCNRGSDEFSKLLRGVIRVNDVLQKSGTRGDVRRLGLRDAQGNGSRMPAKFVLSAQNLRELALRNPYPSSERRLSKP